MRASPRSPLIPLLGLALVAALGLGWLLLGWDGSAQDGRSSAVSMEGMGGQENGSWSDRGGDSLPSLGVDLAGKEAMDLETGGAAGPSRSSISPSRTSLSGGWVEYVSVLTVEDLDSGMPVVGASVAEYFYADVALIGEDAWRASLSGEDGRLEVVGRVPIGRDENGQVPEEIRVDLRLYADGFMGAMATAVLARVEEPSEGLELQEVKLGSSRVVGLERAGALVLDVLGAPPGHSGELAVWFDSNARDRKADLSFDWPIRATRSQGAADSVSVEQGAAGAVRVTLSSLPPGTLSAALAIEGHPVALQQSLQLAPGERLVETLKVTAGEAAHGVVLDTATKQPVEGVLVQVTPGVSGLTQRLDELPYPAQTTDSRGGFLIAGLPQGEIEVSLITVDGARHDRKITIVKGNHARVHRLGVRGSASLSGRVDLPDGVSGAGLQVLVTTADAAAQVRRRDGGLAARGDLGPGVFADVDSATGEFEAASVPSGRQLVIHAMASATSLGIVSVPALQLGEAREDVVVTLTPRSEVLFRVNSTSGDVVDHIRVSFRGPWTTGATGAGKKRRAPSRWTNGATLEVRGDGLFAALPTVEEIEAIRIRWGSGTSGDFPWPGTSGSEVPAFELDPLPAVLFDVVGSNGVAVSGARIRAVPAQNSQARAAGKAPRLRGPTAKANEFGRARLLLPRSVEGSRRVTYRVRVTAEGFAAQDGLLIGLEDALPADSQQIVLERAERTELARMTGRLVRGNGEALAAPRFEGLRGGTAHVDEHAFELRGLRPGRLSVAVHCNGYESLLLPRATLQPGERLDVGEVVMRPATRLDVIVKDAKGKKLREAQVRLIRLSVKQGGRKGLPRSVNFPRQSEPVGRFRRSNVPRAKWRLVVNHPKHRTYSQIVTVSGAAKTLQVGLKAKP
ncbi:MAG: hypothetical protein ACI80K_000413 [Paracoccaceae bacterium]|jgi:hypothetical protein